MNHLDRLVERQVRRWEFSQSEADRYDGYELEP